MSTQIWEGGSSYVSTKTRSVSSKKGQAQLVYPIYAWYLLSGVLRNGCSCIHTYVARLGLVSHSPDHILHPFLYENVVMQMCLFQLNSECVHYCSSVSTQIICAYSSVFCLFHYSPLLSVCHTSVIQHNQCSQLSTIACSTGSDIRGFSLYSGIWFI